MEQKIIQGDSLKELAKLADESVDLLCTDPPYGYSFMGKSWDKTLPNIGIFKECFRVLKPGAFAFVMSAPRSDVCARMMLLLEDAGFEIGFTPIYWTYASGFPKAMNIGKMVDKRNGEKVRSGVGIRVAGQTGKLVNPLSVRDGGEPFTAKSDAAKLLDGSYGGFQPKPAVEVVIVAMKPLSEKTYVDQALKNGKGITWLDKCRIPLQGSDQDDSICTCQCDHSKCDAPSAAKISGQREATKKEKQMSSVPENVATPFSEKILGILPEDTSKIITSCSEETSGGNTTISLNTSGSGKKKTAQSQKDTKSTTETTTNETTASKTCSCSLHTTIEKSTTEGIRNGGRFPANILVSDDVLNDGTVSKSTGVINRFKSGAKPFGGAVGEEYESIRGVADSGSYSRYFSLDSWWEDKIKHLPESAQKTFPFLLCPKAAKSEKNAGLDGTCTVKYNEGTCQENQLALTLLEKVTSDIQGVKWSIGESGESITAQCPSASLSTILTTIKKTTGLRILHSLMLLLTKESTEGANSEKVSGGNHAESAELLKKLIQTTTNAKTELVLGASRVAYKMLSLTSEEENWSASKNIHSTVKPLKLMSYLITLGSRPGDVVLDPFLGSGTTAIAAKQLGRECIGIEREAEYVEIARARTSWNRN